jgi:hypothetical protein
MRKRPSLKDTKKYWRERKKARASLDKKRSSASISTKVEIAARLRSDAMLLKSSKIISSKP